MCLIVRTQFWDAQYGLAGTYKFQDIFQQNRPHSIFTAIWGAHFWQCPLFWGGTYSCVPQLNLAVSSNSLCCRWWGEYFSSIIEFDLFACKTVWLTGWRYKIWWKITYNNTMQLRPTCASNNVELVLGRRDNGIKAAMPVGVVWRLGVGGTSFFISITFSIIYLVFLTTISILIIPSNDR